MKPSQLLRLPVITGSAALFAGSLVSGAVNYLFNVLLAREQWLGPVDYGTLAALLSSLTLVALIGTTIATVTTKFTAAFEAEGMPGKIGRLIKAMQRRVILYGLPILILLAGSSRYLAGFFNIDTVWPILLLIPLILLTLLLHPLAGALQGLLKFSFLSFLSMVGAALRLLLALVAVLAGGRVVGVLLACLASEFIIYLLAHLPVRSYLAATVQSIRLPKRDIINFGGPVFIATLGIMSFFSIDIILAKHYLPADQSGIYSGLSILARVVYFASLPFLNVMFPIVSQAAAKRQSSRGPVALTLGAALAISIMISGLYFTWPQLVINYSIGAAYLSGQAMLGYLAMFISFVSVAAWLIHYLLAHQNTKAVWIFPAAVVVQIFLIIRWHSNIEQIVWSSLASSALLISGLMLYSIWWLIDKKRAVDNLYS